jgi:hypothetical protein
MPHYEIKNGKWRACKGLYKKGEDKI